MRPTGSMISSTIFTVAASPSRCSVLGLSWALAQAAGTSNLWKAVAPMSMALWFMSTTSWPFFR